MDFRARRLESGAKGGADGLTGCFMICLKSYIAKGLQIFTLAKIFRDDVEVVFDELCIELIEILAFGCQSNIRSNHCRWDASEKTNISILTDDDWGQGLRMMNLG